MSTTAPGARGNAVLAIICIVLAVCFLAGAVFYFTQNTSLFAGSYGIHYKHAILCVVLAVVSLVAANFLRPRSA